MRKKIKYIFKPAQFTSPHDLEVMGLLLNAQSVEMNENYVAGKGVVAAQTALGGLFLPTEGLIDIEAEKTRLKKEIEKYEAEISKAGQKLNNPNFAQKVPASVLQEHQQRLVEWQDKRDHAKTAFAALD